MDDWKKRTKLKEIMIAAVCLAAICMSGFSIYSTNQMRQAASRIYEHPYTVSNESRAMRYRLLDMRSLLPDIVAEPGSEIEEVRQVLDQQYATQYDAIEVITRQYLGSAEDTARLLAAMQDLERT